MKKRIYNFILLFTVLFFTFSCSNILNDRVNHEKTRTIKITFGSQKASGARSVGPELSQIMNLVKTWKLEVKSRDDDKKDDKNYQCETSVESDMVYSLSFGDISYRKDVSYSLTLQGFDSNSNEVVTAKKNSIVLSRSPVICMYLFPSTADNLNEGTVCVSLQNNFELYDFLNNLLSAFNTSDEQNSFGIVATGATDDERYEFAKSLYMEVDEQIEITDEILTDLGDIYKYTFTPSAGFLENNQDLKEKFSQSKSFVKLRSSSGTEYSDYSSLTFLCSINEDDSGEVTNRYFTFADYTFEYSLDPGTYEVLYYSDGTGLKLKQLPGDSVLNVYSGINTSFAINVDDRIHKEEVPSVNIYVSENGSDDADGRSIANPVSFSKLQKILSGEDETQSDSCSYVFNFLSDLDLTKADNADLISSDVTGAQSPVFTYSSNSISECTFNLHNHTITIPKENSFNLIYLEFSLIIKNGTIKCEELYSPIVSGHATLTLEDVIIEAPVTECPCFDVANIELYGKTKINDSLPNIDSTVINAETFNINETIDCTIKGGVNATYFHLNADCNCTIDGDVNTDYFNLYKDSVCKINGVVKARIANLYTIPEDSITFDYKFDNENDIYDKYQFVNLINDENTNDENKVSIDLDKIKIVEDNDYILTKDGTYLPKQQICWNRTTRDWNSDYTNYGLGIKYANNDMYFKDSTMDNANFWSYAVDGDGEIYILYAIADGSEYYIYKGKKNYTLTLPSDIEPANGRGFNADDFVIRSGTNAFITYKNDTNGVIYKFYNITFNDNDPPTATLSSNPVYELNGQNQYYNLIYRYQENPLDDFNFTVFAATCDEQDGSGTGKNSDGNDVELTYYSPVLYQIPVVGNYEQERVSVKISPQDVFGEYSPAYRSAEISDLQIVYNDSGEKVLVALLNDNYALSKKKIDNVGNDESPKIPVTCRGALLLFDEMNVDKGFNVSGNSSSAHEVSLGSEISVKKGFYGQRPSDSDFSYNCFIAPQKFVAVKPKELTIADYGYVLKEEIDLGGKSIFEGLAGNAIFKLSGENLEFSEASEYRLGQGGSGDVSKFTPYSGDLTDSKTLEMISCTF